MAKSDSSCYVGVDLGGTNIGTAVIDAKGHVLNETPEDLRTKTKANQGADSVVERIAEAVDAAIEDAGLKRSDIHAVGIGAPGTCDLNAGVVKHAVNLRWTDFPLADELSAKLGGLSVTVDNDVNVAAWGEYKAGAGVGHHDMLAVWVGTGVGGGLVLDGALYHGHHMTAGEIGHTVLYANAMRGRSTLEQTAGRVSMIHQLTRLVEQHYETVWTEVLDSEKKKIGSKKLASAYESGDALTVEVVNHAADAVGSAIANQVTMLSLPCVVVGGGVTEAMGQPWIDRIRRNYERHVHPPYLRDCRIVPSQLEDLAGIIGAGLLAAERVTG